MQCSACRRHYPLKDMYARYLTSQDNDHHAFYWEYVESYWLFTCNDCLTEELLLRSVRDDDETDERQR